MAMRLTCLCPPATPSMRQGRFPPDEEMPDADAHDALRRLAQDVLADADLIVTSPLRRVSEVVARLGLSAVADPALRDLSSGAWAGCGLAELPSDQLATWLDDPHRAPPGGESRAALRSRAAAWLGTVPGMGRHVVAITHPAVVRALLSAAIGTPPQSDHALDVAPLTRARLSWTGRWRVQGFGLPP